MNINSLAKEQKLMTKKPSWLHESGFWEKELKPHAALEVSSSSQSIGKKNVPEMETYF